MIGLALLWRRERQLGQRSSRNMRQELERLGSELDRLLKQLGLLEAALAAGEAMLVAVDSELRVSYANQAAVAQFSEPMDRPGLFNYSGSLDLVRLSNIDGMNCGGSPQPAPEPQGMFEVIPAMTGAWYDPSHDGEGWLLEILPDGRALVAWFSYDPEGRQAWFLNVGAVTGNRIDFELLQPGGTDFGPTFDADEITFPPWGAMSMTFDDCDNGTLTYSSDLPGYGAGSLSLQRLTQVSTLACE